MNTNMKALVFILAMPQMVFAFDNKTNEMIEKAPALVIALDNSGSSPATDKLTMERAWPLIRQKAMAMPMASQVTIFTVGDASRSYLSKTWRVQAKATEDGDTLENIASELEGIVLNFSSQVGGQQIATHGQTEMVGGFYDISKLLNAKSPDNKVVVVSDLIENSNHADCYTNKKCPLPKPSFSLAGADITVLGVGSNLPANEAINISNVWDGFLKKAGAKTTNLKRVF